MFLMEIFGRPHWTDGQMTPLANPLICLGCLDLFQVSFHTVKQAVGKYVGNIYFIYIFVYSFPRRESQYSLYEIARLKMDHQWSFKKGLNEAGYVLEWGCWHWKGGSRKKPSLKLTVSLPLKINGWKMIHFLLGPGSLFRGQLWRTVSFMECIPMMLGSPGRPNRVAGF